MEYAQISSRLRLRHIRCFIAIARERHLGRAAEDLGLTQPAVSKTLSELEEVTGVHLVNRGRQGAQLTKQGERFLSYALSVVEALDAAVESVRPSEHPRDEHIRIGALPSVGPHLLPAALALFAQARPSARVTVDSATNMVLLDSLKAGKLDFILARMSDPEAMIGMSFDLLYVEPLILAVARDHPLVRQDGSALSEIITYPLVISIPGTLPRHRTESFLSAHGVQLPHGYVETLSVSLARLLVLKNQSVWFAPQGAVRDDLTRGDMVALPIDTGGTEEPVGLVRRSDNDLTAGARDLVQLLRTLTINL